MPIHPIAFAALLAAFVLSPAAHAQEYPVRPVRIVLGFAAGGGADGNLRLISSSMTKRLGQNVFVDNRPGAGGVIAAQHVASQAPDGYTLILSSPSLSIHSARPDTSIDMRRDLGPVVFVGTVTQAFYVHPSVPVKNMEEFVAYAKSRPGRLSYASVGIGSGSHLTFEMLKRTARLFIVHVPYRSSAQTTMAVAAGDVEIGHESFSSLRPLAEAGKLRMLAVSSAKRSPRAPELPGMEESGIKGVDYSSWIGISAPAGMQRDVVTKLNAAFNATIREPEIQGVLERAGYEIVGGTPEFFARWVDREVGGWSAIIRDAKIVFE
jgi:tripartite-type tricarboxylate transporter receptor subunit TctC